MQKMTCHHNLLPDMEHSTKNMSPSSLLTPGQLSFVVGEMETRKHVTVNSESGRR